MEARVIDISKHNGSIDFSEIKAAGIYGVIIRAGYGRSLSQKDPMFEENYAGAKAAGLRVGTYWYSYALTAAEALAEAETFLKAIEGKQFELPVYFDIEEKAQVKAGKEVCSEIADTFCSYMEKQGYFAGIYSFDSFFGGNLSEEVQRKYTCWAARVENIRPKYCKVYGMWQYTFRLRLDGVKGDVDCSYLYTDFESIIRNRGLNGFTVKDTKYGLTARIAGLDKTKANEVAEACQKLGMTVVIAEA